MRRAAKVDANQSDVVGALRAAGATVKTLHREGEGCPDLLVGFRGANLLMEVKDGSKPPSARKLTADQVTWHRAWAGQVCIVTTEIEALEALSLAPKSIPVIGQIG